MGAPRSAAALAAAEADAAGPVAAGGARAAPGRLARLRARLAGWLGRAGGGAAGPPRPWLRVASPCHGSAARLAAPAASEEAFAGRAGGAAAGPPACWRGFCACCKRPLHLSLAEAPAPKRARSGDRYAYVVALWGPSPEYLLGALALGWSLRRHGAAHDLVALHADDLPAGAVELLRRGGWAPHQVPHVEACGALFQEWTRNGRFAQVFTKIRVLGLVQYRKVLLLDADIIVNANIDDLFDLPAPAAMARGPRCGYAHGERIDGEFFFGGSQGDEWSWGQTGGINAGVMLLEPDEQTLAQCLLEITDPRHPEHVPGNGPEQDYLSRFWAGEWRHLDVSYNFQLHQMYFALSPLGLSSDRARFLDGTGPARIKAVHFSADPKPWARYLDPGYAGLADDAWLDEVRRKFKGYRAWVLQDEGAMSRELGRSGWGLARGADGQLRLAAPGAGAAEEPGAAPAAAEGGPAEGGPGGPAAGRWPAVGDPVRVSESAVRHAEDITRWAVQQWTEAYRGLSEELGGAGAAAACLAAAAGEAGAAAASATPGGGGGRDGARSAGGGPRWEEADGWWLTRPGPAAEAACAAAPEPRVVLTVGGAPVLAASSAGLHLAAACDDAGSGTCPAPRSFGSAADLPAAVRWAEDVPQGATVLLAVVDCCDFPARAALAALHGAGLGCPSAPPPAGFAAMAAVGRKGPERWRETHAAPSFALATARL